MNALEWWFCGFTVAFLMAAGLMVFIVVGARADQKRGAMPDIPEVETQPTERRGAWSRMVCRNRRVTRLGRWARINKVIR